MEIWKDVKGYEGVYMASNLGNIKSLSRTVNRGNGLRKIKDKILKLTPNSKGYYSVTLYKDLKPKTRVVHQIIAESFLNHSPCGYEKVINHINFNKLDNRLCNLEITTQRQNANHKHIPSTSKYVGVCFDKPTSKWESSIYVNGKKEYLGRYINEKDAHFRYQERLRELNEN